MEGVCFSFIFSSVSILVRERERQRETREREKPNDEFVLGVFDALQQMNDLLLGENIGKPELFSGIQFGGKNQWGSKNVFVEKTGSGGK